MITTIYVTLCVANIIWLMFDCWHVYYVLPICLISDLCRCGNEKNDPKHIFKNETKWFIDTCTETSETDAYGIVEFPAYGQKTSKVIIQTYRVRLGLILSKRTTSILNHSLQQRYLLSAPLLVLLLQETPQNHSEQLAFYRP